MIIFLYDPLKKQGFPQLAPVHYKVIFAIVKPFPAFPELRN